MGQILSAPVTTKHSTEGENKRLMFGASSMQGWRISMEDAHTHILEYKDTGAAFFGVFDGHGGANVAKYSSQKLKENVFESEAFQKGEFKESLRDAFFKIDSDLRKDPEFQNEASGSTAIVALLTKDNTLYVSNAGDSRAIISTHGLAVALSQDHKPSHPKESERIQGAGGHVEFGRVNGNLALSRALGDFEFKCTPDLPPEKQAVTAEPDITTHTLTEKDEFMVLACDGIWDCLTNQEVVNFVRKHVANHVPLREICENLMDSCLADSAGNGGIGCDNMTVEIVAFLNGKTKEEWYNSIRETVKATSPSDIKEYSMNEPQTQNKTTAPSESRQYSAQELEKLADLTIQNTEEERVKTTDEQGNSKQ